MLSIIGIVAISGCISQNNPLTQSNITTQPLGQVSDSVMKACLSGKPQPMNYATVSCNTGSVCNIDFRGNDIYLRVVPSGSMCPSEFIGDYLVFMRTKDNTNFKIGDVLNYQSGIMDAAHRIVDYCNGGYVLRGDFNNVDDGCILYNQIIGVHVAIIKGIK